MEEECNGNKSKKRVREYLDLHPDSPESKRVRDELDVNSSESKVLNSDKLDIKSAESELDSVLNLPKANNFRNDILYILDDDPDNDSAIQDLDSVIKSFEEEIHHQTPPAPETESGKPQPELGYLLEASDDELGLPPAISPSGKQPPNKETMNSAMIVPEAVPLADMLGYDDEIPSYDSLELEIDEGTESNNGMEDFVALDSLFDYSDPSEFSWKTESLPAL
ncbi:unnamed protein product [Ilex paraguariensis]|uniref:Uncharacterized protein n=1 Tax=Ilex paraguariensis TaxID=185542 RepID=A0ABC8UZW1_9AQUA